MLENLSIPHYAIVRPRENVTGADNQQERPVGKLEIANSDARFVSGHGFSRAARAWFWEGHDFSRAMTAAKIDGASAPEV
jgi:hypothetical protein